jgi:hypothetical protein
MGRFFLFLEENQWVRNMLFFGCGVFFAAKYQPAIV